MQVAQENQSNGVQKILSGSREAYLSIAYPAAFVVTRFADGIYESTR